jgi:hypothetical protein
MSEKDYLDDYIADNVVSFFAKYYKSENFKQMKDNGGDYLYFKRKIAGGQYFDTRIVEGKIYKNGEIDLVLTMPDNNITVKASTFNGRKWDIIDNDGVSNNYTTSDDTVKGIKDTVSAMSEVADNNVEVDKPSDLDKLMK